MSFILRFITSIIYYMQIPTLSGANYIYGVWGCAHLAKLNEHDYTLVSFFLQYLPPFVPKIGGLGGLPPHPTP
jgi:hypothetical protein